MTVLEDTIKGIKHFNVDVDEENGNVVFLHKIVQGSASKSYGIHVAKLAGAPKELIESAQYHLDSLNAKNESNVNSIIEPVSQTKEEKSQVFHEEVQLSLFDAVPNQVLQKLREIDLMNTTPSAAYKLLEELKEII